MESAIAPPSSIYERARRIAGYDEDPDRPGRPVWVMFGGAAVMGLCLVLALILGYRTWYLDELPANQSYYALSFLFAIYASGAFLFSLGYELFDTGRAFRLALIISVISVVAVALVIATFAALAKVKAGGDAIRSIAGAENVQDHGLIGAIVSFSGDGQAAEKSFEPIPTPETFTIGCPGCGERFTPAPPSAICPACGVSALT